MKRLLELTMTALLAVCCTSQVLDPSAVEPGVPGLDGDMLILGGRLEDPYTVENMTKALGAVYPTKASRVPVTPTHYYLRFLPKNKLEYRILENLGVDLYDHPLDYEIVREGDWYHDPDIPEGQITWQYAVVPKDEILPRFVQHEILDECYIPDEDMQSTAADVINWAAVERES